MVEAITESFLKNNDNQNKHIRGATMLKQYLDKNNTSLINAYLFYERVNKFVDVSIQCEENLFENAKSLKLSEVKK